MEPKTTVLITGSNRGIGLGLVERFLAKPSHIVIAAVRNPDHPTAQALHNLPRAHDTQLIVVKIDANIEKDAHDAVAELQQKHGVAHFDIVTANAGVAYIYPSVADVKIEDIKAHMQPNVYGVIALYQATRELLKKAAREPIFLIMGSTSGLLGWCHFLYTKASTVSLHSLSTLSGTCYVEERYRKHLPIPNAAYAPTKTVLNWYTRRIDAEDDWLNCFAIDPGHVSTDMGNAGARAVGIGDYAPTSVQESCDGLMNVLAKSSKKEYGGKLAVYKGGFHGW